MENDKLVRLSDVSELKLKYAENDDIRDGWFGAIDAVMNLPAVDAVEVRHGEWLFRQSMDWCVCSECGSMRPPLGVYLTNFCSNCGAKMDGGKHETD